MDDKDKSTVAVWVDSTGHNPFLGPDLNYGCDYEGVSIPDLICVKLSDLYLKGQNVSECLFHTDFR